MKTQIEPLTKTTYKPAVEIAVATGERKDVEERLLNLDKYYVAMLDGQVVGVIGWYLDDGNWAGDALGDDFPDRENVFLGESFCGGGGI